MNTRYSLISRIIILVALAGLWYGFGCGPAPAKFTLPAVPCVHDSQCEQNLGFRCKRLVCVRAEVLPPPPPIDAPTPDASAESVPDTRITPPETPPEPRGCVDGGTRPCYTGPPNTKDLGVCKSGTQECLGGQWLRCINEETPTNEVCDLKDNNCDGNVDEGCGVCVPGETRSCGSHKNPPCQLGVSTCDSNNKWGACVGSISPSKEECDGVDNDCNGDIDETFDLKGKVCTDMNTAGPCNQGKWVCDGGLSRCVPDGSGGTPEVCNNKDDDCDGKIDEDFATKGDPCTDGVGGCKVSGINICNVSGVVECNARRGTPAAKETCGDNIDNDCNGQTDEGCNVSASPQCKTCSSENDCGTFGGRKGTCFDIGQGKHCYQPCGSGLTCPRQFVCLNIGGSDFCGLPYRNSAASPVFVCENYNFYKDPTKTCQKHSDCGWQGSGYRGGYCNSAKRCTVYCGKDDHCATGKSCVRTHSGSSLRICER